MALPDMNKQEFCAKWEKGDFKGLFFAAAKAAAGQDEMFGMLNKALIAEKDKAHNVACTMLRMAWDTGDADLKKTATELVGVRETAVICLENGYALSEEERSFILAHLN